jgi:hypothetical protein
MRLGSMDTAVRFAPRLEKEFLPQSKIGMKLQELLGLFVETQPRQIVAGILRLHSDRFRKITAIPGPTTPDVEVDPFDGK